MDRSAEDLVARLQAVFGGTVTRCCEPGCCGNEQAQDCCTTSDPGCCAG